MRPWSAVACTYAAAAFFGFSVSARRGGLTPPPVARPHELTAAALQAYVTKTFGPSQRCLSVASEPSAEADTVVAMLHDHRTVSNNRSHRYATARTIVLNESGMSGTAYCLAYVVVGRRLPFVMEYMDNFRDVAANAERMLVIVVQDRNYIKPFIRYTPAYFNYKDVVLISAHPGKETVYQMSIYHGKFVPISKTPDQWFEHDLEGKRTVKNFYETRVKLLTYNHSIFSSVVEHNETGELSLSHGVECDIFREVAARLNVTWTVRTTSDADIWGTLWPNKTVTGGTLKWLYTNRADVAFCSLWIEHMKFRMVDMSRFWTVMCLKFLVPKPVPLREKWDLLVKPFPGSVWLLLLLSVVLTAVVARALAAVQKRIGYARIDAFTSLSSTVFWIVGMILLTNIPRAHRLGPVKHLINCWCVFVFVVSTSFSSNLYSYITSPAYSDIILEIGDMLKANYHWGLMYPPSFVTMLNMQDQVHRAFSQRFVPERSVDDRIGRLRAGNYALLTKCLSGKHFTELDKVPATLLNDLRTGRSCLAQFYIGFGFVKHSPYRKSANLVIQRVVESGLVDYWLSRVTELHAVSPATFEQVFETRPHSTTTGRGRPSALSYAQFEAVAVAWLFGCALSAMVFVAELQYDAYVRRRRRLAADSLLRTIYGK